MPDAALHTTLWTLLAAVVLPVWWAGGLLDYAIHRRQRIEHTAGPYESALHLLQAFEVGVPVLVVLFLEITATTFAVLLLAVVVHALTSWRDTCYATSVRLIGPAEQKAHAVLDMVPWFALALIAVIHRDALAPLLGHGSADWSLRLRDAPFEPAVIAYVLVGSVGAGVVPALLELARGRRVIAGNPTSTTSPR